LEQSEQALYSGLTPSAAKGLLKEMLDIEFVVFHELSEVEYLQNLNPRYSRHAV